MNLGIATRLAPTRTRWYRQDLRNRSQICYTQHMTRDDVIAKLRELRPELEAQGAKAVYLFGSFARGTADQHSDIDIAIDIDQERKPRFGVFDLIAMAHFIEDNSARHADVVVRDRLTRIRANFDRDAVLVYG